jgi:hypothetical protein
MGCSIDSSSSYQANNLVIPDKVKLADNTIRPLTSIGDECFKYDIGLTGHLILNNEVNVIGNYAFYDCKNLSGSLVIPDSVTSIGTQAFCDCSGFLSDV